MGKIQDFIQDARDKKLDDAAIRDLLKAAGWQQAEIDAGMLGVEVPRPDGQHVKDGRPALSPLEAALHHVLLWVFVLATSIALSAVSATLFGGNQSLEAIAAYIAVAIVTLVPYAVFYSLYLKKLRKNQELTTHRVWSIITIVLHSLGTIAALITLIVTLIVDTNTSVIVASSSVAVLGALVVVAYAAATFMKPEHAIRKAILYAYLPLLVLFLAVYGVLAVMKMPDLRADKMLRQDLVTSVQNIVDYAKTNKKLPEQATADIIKPGITYTKTSDTEYKVCGDFKTSAGYGYAYPATDTASYPTYDSYVSEYQFMTDKGNHCFTFQSAPLSGIDNPDAPIKEIPEAL